MVDQNRCNDTVSAVPIDMLLDDITPIDIH